MLMQNQIGDNSRANGDAGLMPFGAEPQMRVLMVVESAAGGTGRHVLDLSEGLIKRGCEVHLVYSTRRMDRMFQSRMESIPRLRRAIVPMRTTLHPSDFTAVRAVRRYMRDNGPFDAVHGHSSKGGAIARLGAAFSGVPAFYTVHGLIMLDPMMAGWKRLFYLNVERALGLVTSHIIAVSPEEARATARMRIGSRIVMVPNGIGELELTAREQARRAMGLADESLAIGFVGRLVPQKAPDILLRAFALVAQSNPQAVLVMIGSGPLADEMEKLAAQLGVQTRIRWLGERDAREYLAGFDLFALASRKEGLPYVILEAMAAGLPIVATSTSGVECLIHHGRNGFVVPPDNVAALARPMIELLDDSNLRLATGWASHGLVRRFTIDAMVDATLGVYRAAMQARLAKTKVDRHIEDFDEEMVREIA
jgi:glycosyltransferase involved in cell wall biosynthesis